LPCAFNLITSFVMNIIFIHWNSTWTISVYGCFWKMTIFTMFYF
jgi:hypothetical protein